MNTQKTTTSTPPKKKVTIKPKFNRSTLLKIIILVGVLAVAAFLIHDSTHTQRAGAYDVSWTTAQKYSLLKEWLPEGVDFTAAADITRLSSIPKLDDFLEKHIFKGNEAGIRMISPLLASNKIGMIAVSLNLSSSSAAPFFVVVVQGDFSKLDLVDFIKEELTKEKASLVSKKFRGIKIYWQKGSKEPFAFAMPNKNHLLVGTHNSLEHVIKSPKSKVPLQSIDSPLFGMLRFSGRIRKVLPAQIAHPELARFAADDHGLLRTYVECPDVSEANNLKLFLAGMKALYMLQGEENEGLLSALEKISIDVEGSGVHINIPLNQLPEIFPK